MRRIELRCGYVQRRWLAVDASVPDASAEGCDVDGILVGWIRNHAMGPLEIESRNAGPVFAAIHRTPRRGFKASSVQPIRIPWVNSDVINMSVAIQNLPPGFAGIFGKKNAAAVAMYTGRSRPCRQIDPGWRERINRQTIGPIRARGQ